MKESTKGEFYGFRNKWDYKLADLLIILAEVIVITV